MADTPLAQLDIPRVRVAIVGFGKMGQLHLKALRNLPEVDVIAAVDPDPARRVIADALDIASLPTLDDLMGAVDAAIVATPSDRHASITIELLSRGVDCLVEKPIALDPNEARLMLDAAAGGAVLAVGQSERFNNGLDRALEAMDGIGGDVTVLRTARPGADDSPADVIQDLMVHDLDWVLRREGDCTPALEVTALQHVAGRLVGATCWLRFATRSYQVTARYDAAAPERTVTLHPIGQPPRSFPLRHDSSGSNADPLTRQAIAFLAHRRGLPSAICTGEAALQVLELTERLRQICRLTEPMELRLESNPH